MQTPAPLVRDFAHEKTGNPFIIPYKAFRSTPDHPALIHPQRRVPFAFKTLGVKL